MPKNVVDTTDTTKDAGTPSSVISSVDRSGLHATLAGAGLFTVFAPSADAFAWLLK